jgi:Tol biopolymer transport system component
MPLSSGTRIGPYEIVGWIGAGGMGEVYRARDPRLGRDVAIKLLPQAFAADRTRLHRFEQEARAAGQINHPNILAVYDVGTHDGTPYIVSELLEGASLRSRMDGGALGVAKAVAYARQIAEGLAAAHDKGVVHRDLKPDNLFVTQDGRVKILDFGIAKLARPTDEPAVTGAPTGTEPGMVIGTLGYMSPEQVRGEAVDHRSDLFNVGTILYEMLTGRLAFARGTAADSMAAILKEEPAPLPTSISPALARIVGRCLEKSREARFQSARDLAFGLEVLSGTNPAISSTAAVPSSRRVRRLVATAALVIAMAVTAWLAWPGPPSIEEQLARATFTPLTNTVESEVDATISRDGKFIAYMSDRDGVFHPYLRQIGDSYSRKLIDSSIDQRNPGLNRSIGFSADERSVWIGGNPGRRLSVVPFVEGPPRPFLSEYAVNVVWSRDGTRLFYFSYLPGDPMFVAESTGANPRQIHISDPGEHNHFPAWSIDDQWIYYAHGSQDSGEYDIWRIPSDGSAAPERLTSLKNEVRDITPIDLTTLLYVAPDEDRSGPWLWALDLETRRSRRVTVGLERYLSIAASANSKQLLATMATSTANLWSVPIGETIAEERDVTPYPMFGRRALAPRFAKTGLFFLSSTGAADGLFRLETEKPVEIWKGVDGALLESPVASPDHDRVAVVLRRQGKLRLWLVSADRADNRSLSDAIEVRGTAAWSPDAKWIVTGGFDASGQGLFKIPVDGGAPIKLHTGPAFDPVWSPNDDVIVFVGRQTTGAPLEAMTTNGTPLKLLDIRIPMGGSGRARFLPNGDLIYVQGPVGSHNFWRLNLGTGEKQPLTRLANPASIYSFDISRDGRRIVFDRVRENGDIVLIQLK